MATAAAVVAGGLTIATGLAVAVDLPDQASDTAKDKAAEHTTTTSTTTTATVGTTADTDNVTNDAVTSQSEGHGEAVSNLARTTEPGPDHGATVCDFASDGACTEGRNNGTNDTAITETESDTETTGTVTAGGHQPAERGKSAEHRPTDE